MIKTSFLVSVALAVLTVPVVVLLWLALTAAGLLGQLDSFASTVIGSAAGTPVTVLEAISAGQVAAFAAILALVNCALLPVGCTMAAVLYNVFADIAGGSGATFTDG